MAGPDYIGPLSGPLVCLATLAVAALMAAGAQHRLPRIWWWAVAVFAGIATILRIVQLAAG